MLPSVAEVDVGEDLVGRRVVGRLGLRHGVVDELRDRGVDGGQVVFVVENNGYAEATSSAFHQAGVDVAKRADGFGMPGIVVDGFDFFAVHEAAGEAIRRARSGGGPTLLECKVGRYYGHFEGDQQTYRGANEVEDLRRDRDCLDSISRRVTEAGIVDAEELAAIDREVATLIDEAVAEAHAAADPTPADVLTDVYVAY